MRGALRSATPADSHARSGRIAGSPRQRVATAVALARPIRSHPTGHPGCASSSSKTTSDIAANLGDYLEDRGHTVDFAADGVTGLHLAVVHDFDAIVLDLNLPGMDGLEVCRKLRNEARKQTPVLMLTARDRLDNKLAGFDSGADDYLIKPFALQEVEVRLNALARRGRGVQTRVLEVGDLEYNLDTLEVRREGKLLQLNPTALKILQALMEASPAVVTRQELETRVWGEELPDSDSLRVHIHGLRAVVDKPFADAADPDPPRHRLPHRRARCQQLTARAGAQADALSAAAAQPHHPVVPAARLRPDGAVRLSVDQLARNQRREQAGRRRDEPQHRRCTRSSIARDPQNPEPAGRPDARVRVSRPTSSRRCAPNQPDWYELPDGIHGISGTDDRRQPFSYKLAVRKTPRRGSSSPTT